MIFPVFVERILWSILDWGSAIGKALGHAALGTLCAPTQICRHPE